VDLVGIEEELATSGADDPDALDRRRALGRALAESLDDAGKAIWCDRLEQIVERLDRKCVDGVTLVRGDEDDRRRSPPRRRPSPPHGRRAGSAAHRAPAARRRR
jgi:hypothetical protein